MKQKSKILFALLAVALLLCVATVTLVACGEKNDDAPQISGGSDTTPSEHEHTFEEKWSHNEQYHWHAATCDHTTEKKDEAEHQLVWTTTMPASCEDDGVQTGTCVCGYSETKSIDALEHDFNTAWVYDDYEHWHKCSRCEETDAHIAHELVDHNCDCGYSEFTPESEFTFSEIDGEWAITGYSGNRSVVVIPSTYRGRDVVELGMGAFYGNTSIKKVYIPDTVASMRDGVFDGCINLNEVISPIIDLSSVSKNSLKKLTFTSGTRIEAEAFKDYTKLAEINLPVDDIVFVGKDAFANTAWLKAKKGVVYIGKVLYTYVGTTPNSFELSVEDDTVAISPSAFEGKNIYKVTIPNDVSIGANAFKDTNIQRAIIPTSAISAIPKSNLRYLEITSGTSITKGALKDCKNLQEIVLPFVGGSASATSASASTLFGYLFASVQPTENANYYREINQYYGKNSSESVTYYIPSSIRNVTIKGGQLLYGAFYGCISINTLNIGEEVTSIADNAFSGCQSLQKIVVDDKNAAYQSKDGVLYKKGDKSIYHVPSSIRGAVVILDGCTSIGNSAFSDRTDITSITISDSVQSIGSKAFSGCTGLKTVNWNATNCTKVGSYVNSREDYTIFKGCTQLTTVNIGENVQSIPSYAFYGCIGIAKVNVTSLKTWCEIKFGNYYYSANPLYAANSNKAGTAKLYVNDEEVTGDVNIPSGTTKIGDHAFYMFTGITSVTIPDSVQSIGDYAFYGCTGLQTVTIESGSIGDYAFSGCTGLQTVTIESGSIGKYAFEGCTGLQTVTIESGSISRSAFSGCTGLQTVTIGDGVTSIGDYAFYGCTSLTEITIPDSVQSIGEDAFHGCKDLKEITIPASVISIGEDAFRDCTDLQVATINAQSIGEYAFSGCKGLQTVTIGEGVQSIGDNAFRYCTGLQTVNWNATNCTYVAGYLNPIFNGCTGLTTVNIGDNVQSIPSYAFYDCTGLSEITIPESVQSIGSSAFSGCTGLSEITIPDSVTSIGSSAFSGCTGLSEITIPDSVTSIGKYAFGHCTGLQTVTIGENVTSIGDEAFSGCTGITSVTIPDSVQSIDSKAFSGCTGLKTVNWNATNCTKVGSYVNSREDYTIFKGCTQLTTVNIGENVQSIPAYAFYGCTGLTSITIPDSVTSIGDEAFYNCTGLQTVNWNATNCTTAGSVNYPIFGGCTGLATVNIGDDVQSIPAYAFYGCTGLTSITIPDSVTSIGDEAFYNCTGLQTVTIGDGVQSIGDYAFYNTSWYNALPDGVVYINKVLYKYKGEMPKNTTINIKEGTVTISPHAFSGCRSLTEITIPDSVTSIGGEAFYGCTGLKAFNVAEENSVYQSKDGVLYKKADKSIYLVPQAVEGAVAILDGCTSIGSSAFSGRTGLHTVTMENGVQSIDDYAFYNCTGLQSVTIGEGVQSIYKSAFYGCTGLQTVYYEGTSEQWDSISIYSGNDNLQDAERYYFSAQDPYQEGTATEGEKYWHWNEETNTPEVWVKQD